jgi:hypothetical protein
MKRSIPVIALAFVSVFGSMAGYHDKDRRGPKWALRSSPQN